MNNMKLQKVYKGSFSIIKYVVLLWTVQILILQQYGCYTLTKHLDKKLLKIYTWINLSFMFIINNHTSYISIMNWSLVNNNHMKLPVYHVYFLYKIELLSRECNFLFYIHFCANARLNEYHQISTWCFIGLWLATLTTQP